MVVLFYPKTSPLLSTARGSKQGCQEVPHFEVELYESPIHQSSYRFDNFLLSSNYVHTLIIRVVANEIACLLVQGVSQTNRGNRLICML